MGLELRAAWGTHVISRTNPSAAPATRRPIVALVVGLLILGALLLGGIVVVVVRSGARAYRRSSVATDQLLQRLEQSDFAGAQRMMARDSDSALEKVSDMLEVIRKRHGRPVGHTGPQTFNFASFNGRSQVTLVYTERFERGQTSVRLLLTPRGDAWEVRSVNFDL